MCDLNQLQSDVASSCHLLLQLEAAATAEPSAETEVAGNTALYGLVKAVRLIISIVNMPNLSKI